MDPSKTPNNAELKKFLTDLQGLINEVEKEWREANRRCARKMLSMGLDFGCIAKANYLTLDELKVIESELLAESTAKQQVDNWLQAIKKQP